MSFDELFVVLEIVVLLEVVELSELLLEEFVELSVVLVLLSGIVKLAGIEVLFYPVELSVV